METKPETEYSEFWCYSFGVCYSSVCSSLEPDAVVERMNALHPTGTSSLWRLSEDKFFRDGAPNPCPCPDNRGTHKHYLLVC